MDNPHGDVRNFLQKKESMMNTKPCWQCGGSGRAAQMCHQCGGARQILNPATGTREMCVACGGRGEIQSFCGPCRGSGQIA